VRWPAFSELATNSARARRRWLVEISKVSVPTMHFAHALLAVLLVAPLCACSAVEDERAHVPPAQEAAHADRTGRMAGFARLEGEWQMKSPGSTMQMFDTWHWGPGRHSMRAMTDGADASGSPWDEIHVFYWHPEREQVRLLGLSTFARGVSEGWVRFDGETADGVFDIAQVHGPRKMGLRWTFDGPDAYHDVLLEETGPAGLEWMNGWDHVRSQSPPAPRPRTNGAPPEPSKLPRLFESLVGRTWEARSAHVGGASLYVRSTFEHLRYADGIYARVISPTQHGEDAHLLDAYVYHHTGTGRVRGLALSDQGGVYEGDAEELADGALEFDLKGYENVRVVPLAVRLELEDSANLRVRIWTVEDSERMPLLDARHEAIEPKTD